ncbi:hypothetical protein OEB99_01620 [Actinotalea sp. M2MS4P-6]|uniref:hypothetical protein n=1 Tax=Actinotalea sp. M2MS4P-6 TaxID=2983762 RepID=UPI0021E42274|nr:hypothetical protein [Actinotalea sp. M2MS4P-6]MCV2392995.1 hypothetical protein [Actinotalea sp. M2MS4P-6]
MARRAQLFVATHAGALARADALDENQPPQSDTPHVELPDIDALDLELLGEEAARAVRWGRGDLEPHEVDLDHELLFQLPPFLVEVLGELGRVDDPDLPGEVASRWATSSERDPRADDPLPMVLKIVGVVTAAEQVGRGVWLWVSPE